MNGQENGVIVIQTGHLNLKNHLDSKLMMKESSLLVLKIINKILKQQLSANMMIDSQTPLSEFIPRILKNINM